MKKKAVLVKNLIFEIGGIVPPAKPGGGCSKKLSSPQATIFFNHTFLFQGVEGHNPAGFPQGIRHHHIPHHHTMRHDGFNPNFFPIPKEIRSGEARQIE